MSTQPTTVVSDDYTVTSSHETAESMIKSLSNAKPEPSEPREVKPAGTEEPEKSDLSKAASELGKEGGKAAAKARKEAAKDETERKADQPGVGEVSGDDPEPDAKAAPSLAEKNKGNPRHDPQARVAEATRAAKEAREELRRERDRAERAERELAAARQPSQPEKQARPVDPGKPKVEDFESYEEFLDARDDYRDNQREARSAQYRQQDEHERRIGRAASEFSKHYEAAAKADPEFRSKISDEIIDLEPSFEAVRASRMPKGENWIADELFLSPEHAPALMLHLSEHPEEFQRIAALSSHRAVTREMAILVPRPEAVTAGTSSEREGSKAKPPLRPVKGSPHTADTAPDDDAPYDEHVRYMNAKEKRQR